MTPEDRLPQHLADDPDFLSSLSNLDQGLSDTDPFVAERILPDVAAPLVAIPGRRPLLDLFPVFFPAEAEAVPPASVPPPLVEPLKPMTYEAFYGLHEHPFGASPDPRFLYHSGAYDRAAQAILGAIARRDRLVVLSGAAGIGKTMLCRTVVEQLDRRTLTSVVVDPSLSIASLLKTVLVDFGVVSREHLAKGQLRYASEAELTEALRDFLASLRKLQAFAVVIIDDAHNLSIEMLRQLQLLTEQLGSGDPRGPEALESVAPLQLMLVGRPALPHLLRRPALRVLKQHVAVQVRLEPLTDDEVGAYVVHRVTVAGNPRVDFDDAAIARMAELSRGVPAVVNALCDRALEEGQRVSTSVVDRPVVDAAGLDLGLGAPRSGAGTLWRAAVTGLTYITLALAGAAVAAYIFRQEIAALMGRR